MTKHLLSSDDVSFNVSVALKEDWNGSDVSAELIPLDTLGDAQVITRNSGVFCGKPWVMECARQVDELIEIDWVVEDGDVVQGNQVLWRLSGPGRSLLTAERTMLNFVQMLSGIATKTAKYAALISHTSTKLLDTRKTIPGLRVAQKYAVLCGGGVNHRMGLFDAYLLKENHIKAAGGIAEAVAAAKRAHPSLAVEVETETLGELGQAIAAGAEIAMIDNYSLEESRQAVELAAGKIKLEASGGINERTIAAIAATGVNFISIGELTKNIDPMDLSMRFV